MRFGLRGLGLVALGALLGLLLALSARWFVRRSDPVARTYTLSQDILVHGNTDLKEVAFTFDDGPKPEVTRTLLNLLGSYGVRATFFVVGKQVELYPGLVRRMMQEGHEVGNHSFHHPTLEGMAIEGIRGEILACDKAIFKATGAHSDLFRPPGMRYDDVVLRAAQDMNYVTVHWNVAAQDYKALDPAVITKRVLSFVQPGSVILLHGHPDTLLALPAIITALQEKGYRFVTVSQMLARLPRPVIVKSNAYGAVPVVAERSPRAVEKVTKKPKAEETPPVASPHPKPVPNRPPIDATTWN